MKKIVRIISIVIILFCLYYIFTWYKENKYNNDVLINLQNSAKLETVVVEIENETINTYNIDFANLLETNSNTIGWINVNNTSIDYPVVQTSNNEFYLTHSFDNSVNGAGWIFADYRAADSSKNLVIYGHNRKDGSMFATLKNVLKKDWYQNSNNHFITYSTPNGTSVYKVFSVYTIENESYYITTDFSSDTDFTNFLTTIKNRSIYNFNTNISTKNPIITLSTCATNNNYRVVLHAIKLETGIISNF